MAKYRITKDGTNTGGKPAGTIVYDLKGSDFGLAFDDELKTGFEHLTVTLSEHGYWPCFTCPLNDLEVVP